MNDVREPFDDEQGDVAAPVEPEVRITDDPPTKEATDFGLPPEDPGTTQVWVDPVMTIEARMGAIEEARQTVRTALARIAEHGAAIAAAADEMRRRS